jgi:hypothetical protein
VVRDGADIRDVEIELSDRPQEVSGRVVDTNGRPADDYTVLLFGKDPARRAGHSRYYAMARPDQSGRFSVSSLPPGEYYAVAVEYVASNEAADPELLDRLAESASAFTLNPEEHLTIELRLVQ